MQVKINQELKNVSNNTTVGILLKDMGYDTGDGIAVAVNDEVIPKNQWTERELNEDDDITLIRATQGG